MLNNGSSSSGHVQWLCVHVEVCKQPSESAFMCVCNPARSHENSTNVGTAVYGWICQREEPCREP